MTRWTTLAIGMVGIVAFGALVWKAAPPSPVATTHSAAVGAPKTPAVASSSEALGAAAKIDVPTGVDGGVPPSDGGGPLALPSGTPKAVRFGVVLVHYRGAEGAPPSARTKEEALRLARELAVDARTDFHATVTKGDSGSMEDAGRMPRGVLEPASEYALFTLKPGEVSDPVDTPRGYWVLRRSE